MSFIPYEHFVIDTSLSPGEAASIVSESVECSGKFVGFVDDRGFKIYRKIWYANGSLPIIRGRFRPQERGVRVEITMTLGLSSIAFVAVWSTVALYLLARSIGEWKSTGIMGGSFLFGLGMIPFLYLIIMLGWVLEAGAARRLIKTMFPRQHIV
jgi:hypothetical protein